MFTKLNIVFFAGILATFVVSSATAAPYLYAVNCGGPRVFDNHHKITYEADTGFYSAAKTIDSDAGKEFGDMPRVKDATVYHTERYVIDNSLTYTVPLSKAVAPSTITLILKFSEVYFTDSNKKVFHVKLGKQIVVNKLDIFSHVGKGVPHDELVELELDGSGKLSVKGGGPVDSSAYDAETKSLKIKFQHIPERDNPKVNAIVVWNGPASTVPKLDPWSSETKPKKTEQAPKRQAVEEEVGDFVDEEDEDLDDEILEKTESWTSDSKPEAEAPPVADHEAYDAEESIWWLQVLKSPIGLGLILLSILATAYSVFASSVPTASPLKKVQKKHT
eukprot:Platyproteum_vivax@DN1925_c0_g1_i1.p1